MPLRLITGSANTGKTGAILAQAREGLRNGRRPVVVVPSRPDAERALAELASEFPVGVRVMTFSGLVGSAWDEFGDGREIVTRARRDLLCVCAARGAGSTAGIALLAAECVERLAESTGVGWRSGVDATTLSPEGSQLAEVIQRYAALLDALDLLEPAEAAWVVPDRSPDWTVPLLVHRFADFTPSQIRLIKRWGTEGEVWVSLTWRDGFAPTAASGGLIEALAPSEIYCAAEVHEADETLRELGESLFATPARLEPGHAVRFSLAEGGEAEAHRVAEEVHLAVMEETASSLDDIAVVFADVEAHYPALRQAFAEAGIPADFDVRTAFTQTSFGSAVGHALGFALSGSRSDVLALVRSPFSGVDCDLVRALERDWRGRGLSDRTQLLDEVRALSPGLAKVLDAMIESSRGAIDAESAAVLASCVRRMYALGVDASTGRESRRAENDAWAHRTVLSALSDLARLAPGVLGLSDLRDALQLQGARPGQGERPGRVQVTAASRIRGRRFGTVIVGGLNVGEIPRPPAEHMLPGSAVDAVMRAFGGESEGPRGIEHEQLLFYLTVTRPRRRLVLSAQTTDGDGEPKQVSPFYETVCDSFRNTDEDADWPEHAFRSLAQAPSPGAGEGSRERIRERAFRGGDGSARVAAARRRGAGRQPGLTDPTLLRALAERDVFSASEIETYLACPYSWFYSRAVRPDELERRFGVAEQGSFAHELLDTVYRRLKKRAMERVTPDTLGAALDELEDSFGEACRRAGPVSTVEEAIARSAARGWAARILEDDATRFVGFAPAHLEWGFGFAGDPITVGSFALRGRVDRIDVDDSGRAIVIDYKRSVAPKASEILGAGKVQMPLYMIAVERELGLRPVAGLYRALRKRLDRGLVAAGALPGDAFVRTDVMPETEFRGLIEAGLALAEEAVAGIREGRIDCEPRNGSSCAHCGAALFCGGA